MGTIDQDILTAEFSRSFVTGNPERQALSMVFTGMLRRSEGVTGGAFQAKKLPRFGLGDDSRFALEKRQIRNLESLFDSIGRRRFWMVR